ncbi:steroid 21-hydroxylase [Lepisosteus oculatus]|uniref:steroid 21-hydroxylase n=1 Tax=Lepisosteus oculatus TaxID=7918 RepID=UPI0035F50A4A
MLGCPLLPSAWAALVLLVLLGALFSLSELARKRATSSTATQTSPGKGWALGRQLWSSLSQVWSSSPSPSCSLPGPPSLPIFGNILDLAREHLPEHLTSLARRYGNIYRLRCGSTDMVVLNSTELIREALVKKWSDFAGRPQSYTGDVVCGGGKDLSLGDYSGVWRAQRRLVHSALQRCRASVLETVITQEAQRLKQVLLGYQETPVDLSEDFTLAASNIITTLVFGKQYEKGDPELSSLHSCLNEIVSLWGSPWISILDSLPFLRRLPNPPFARLLKAVARRDDIIRAHLEDYKKQRLGCSTGGDITAALLQSLESPGEAPESEALTEGHVHMAIVDLLIGGTETTASWLSWTVAFLLHSPQVQSSVSSELRSVLVSRCPVYSDRQTLPHLSALINEVLRLRPVAPLAVPHRATRDSSIAGHFIPKDTVVIANLFGAHHDPALWSAPYCFRPERFLGRGAGAAARGLLPFGGGARLCLGEGVARTELFLFAAHLLRDFEFLPPGGEGPPDLRGAVSVVHKVKPFRVIARPRPPTSC